MPFPGAGKFAFMLDEASQMQECEYGVINFVQVWFHGCVQCLFDGAFRSVSRLSGNAINSELDPSGRHNTRPSSSSRMMTHLADPRNVFTRSPGLNSAD